MKALRPYQQDIYLKGRESLSRHRAICIQSATGSGKTAIMAAMCNSVFEKNKTAWILVSRKELILQSSEHLKKWNVPHNIIAPNMQESNAFNIHVVSSDTLIRRFHKIKRYPDLLLIDECHLMLDRQLEILEHLPSSTKIIGFSATPQRADGRGLSTKAGGVYDELIEGLSIPALTELGYLAPLRYYSPPLDGLDKLHFRGIDADADELEELLQRRKIYGQVVDHYSKHGMGRGALIFCRSIKSAEHTAERFRDRGFRFYNIDGTMTIKKRYELVNALRSGKIDGLCGCDVFVYGLDFPRVSYGATIRPTTSRALYMQAIGRILRPFEGKKDALFFDHCNNILEHQDKNYSGIPLHYVPEIKWNFDGIEKHKRGKVIHNVVLCPHLDFLYCPAHHCATCSHNPDKAVKDCRKPMVVVPATLQEIPKHVAFADRPLEEKREIQDKIGAAVLDYKQTRSTGAINQMLKLADDCRYSVMWVYNRLTDDNRYTINWPLLHEIARIKNYSKGWPWVMSQKIKLQKKIDKEYREVMG